jgi:hypothetical protein
LPRRNLEEITSPLADRLSRRFLKLTPAELKTCNMIRMGLSTKEIADIRHVRFSANIRLRIDAVVSVRLNVLPIIQDYPMSILSEDMSVSG